MHLRLQGRSDQSPHSAALFWSLTYWALIRALGISQQLLLKPNKKTSKFKEVKEKIIYLYVLTSNNALSGIK